MAVHLTVVAFALRRESGPFRRRPRRGRPVEVIETGVGRDAVLAAAERLPRCDFSLISAGFCGGLRPGLAVGDIVEGDGLITVPRLVATADEKRRLHKETGAAAADMESGVWADWCAERGVPFRAVRAVSDTNDTSLSPRLLRLLSGRKASAWRAAAAVVRSPRLLPELLRLAADTRTAAQALAAHVERVVSTLCEPAG